MKKTGLTKAQAVEAIREAHKSFRAYNFTHGEGVAYAKAFESVAKMLEKSTLPDTCTYELEGTSSLSLVTPDGKTLKLFSIFIDRFTMWDNIGKCPEYCQDSLSEYWGTIKACETLLK